MENVREPYVNGAFYPDDPIQLRETIKNFMDKNFEDINYRKLIGIIVPHAGYLYSGSVAAHSYNLLKSNNDRKFLIIGPNHYGYPFYPAIYPNGYWETPLGQARVSEEVASAILNKSSIITDDKEAHTVEHSIEVQIPFLQYMFNNDFEFAPIILGKQDIEIARNIAETVLTMNKIPRIIISSDLNHYLSSDKNNEKDEIILNDILKMNLNKFYYDIVQYNITSCGYGAIAILMIITKKLGGKIKLLEHKNSGETFGDKKRVVGYGALAAIIE